MDGESFIAEPAMLTASFTLDSADAPWESELPLGLQPMTKQMVHPTTTLTLISGSLTPFDS